MNIMFDQSFHVLKQDLPSILKYEDVIFVFEDIDTEAPKIVRKRATATTDHHRPQALATANQVANLCLYKGGKGKDGLNENVAKSWVWVWFLKSRSP